MSKMPAKKKSCFQITSVTQAQVGASSVTDDTESLDDPDESRSEDASSEILFDVTRSDYEPVCDRGSPEEALINIAADTESPFGQLSNNPTGVYRKLGVAGSHSGQHMPGAASSLSLVAQPGAMTQQVAPAPTSLVVNVSQPAQGTTSAPSSTTTTTTASTVSCSSRFRVIKLDHGSGEPFRRGRWTCTEFYEKDSEGSVANRTADSIRHATAPSDLNTDRDSGLGHTGGSGVAPAAHSEQGSGSVDASLSASPSALSMQPVEQQIHHQTYGTVQQGMSGAAAQNAYSSSKSTVVSAQQQPTVGVLQPSATQNLLPVGHSTLPQGSIHIQKSPNMSSAPQPQPVTYPPQQQLSLAHHLTSQPSGLLQSQTEYYQQQQPASMQAAASTGQSLPVSSLSAVSQGLSSVLTASGGVSVPGQGGEMTAAGGGALPAAQMASSLLQPPAGGGGGGGGGSLLVGGSTLQQQTVGQYTIPGQPPTLSLHPMPSGVQNVPAVAVSSSVPTTVPTAVPSASSAAMPNMITSSLLADQQSQLARSHIGALGALGTQSLFAAGFGLMEAGSGRKSDGPALTQPPVDPGKDLMKPLIAESLQLSTPTVNSLFGIPITVDGDEDSASGTGVVPIDNKIEQAMDLVKSHLMYAVREEVEVLKEQIKELYERNSELERENAVLKSLANSDQLSQLSNQPASASPPQPGPGPAQPPSHPQLQHLPNPQ